MPTYEVELDNGDKYHVEADNEPTHDEVLSALGHGQSQSQPQPEQSSAAGSFARGVGANLGKGVGGAGGAIAGAELGLLGGPAAPITVPVGALVGALAGGYLGQKGQEAVQGEEATKAQQAQIAQDQQAHPIASSAGSLLSTLPMMVAAPETGLTSLGGKVVNSAVAGGIFGAGEAGGGVASGQIQPSQVPGEILKSAATMAPLGFIPGAGNSAGEIAGNAYKYLTRPVAEAATLAGSNLAYNTATGEDGPGFVQGTMQNAPGFIALNALASLTHGRVKPLETVKQGEPSPTQPELAPENAPKEGTIAPEAGTSDPVNSIIPPENGPGIVNPPPVSDFPAGMASGDIADFIRKTHPEVTDEQLSQHPEYRAAVDREQGWQKPPEETPPPQGGVEPVRQSEGTAPPPSQFDVSGSTPPVTPGPQAAIKNDQTDIFRVDHGFGERDKGPSFSDKAAVIAANKRIAANGNAVNELVDELRTTPRAHTPEERVMLSYAMHQADAAHDAAAKAKIEADKTGDIAKIDAAREKMDATGTRFLDVIDAAEKSGKASGQSLASRRWEDKAKGVSPNVETFLVHEQAKIGRKLNPKEESGLRQLHKEYFESSKKVEEAKAATQEKEASNAHREAFKEDVKAVQAEEAVKNSAAKKADAEERKRTVKAAAASKLESDHIATINRIQQRNTPSPNVEAKPELSKEKAPRKITHTPATSTEFGNHPFIRAIKEIAGGIKSKSSAIKDGSYEKNKGEWDDAPSLEHPTHNQVYSTTGQAPDKVAKALHEQGMGDGTVEGLWSQVKAASKSAASAVKENAAINKEGKEQSVKDKNFTKANKPGEGKQPIDPNSIYKGDMLTMEGEKVEVASVEYDEDGNALSVTLQDGSKFGRQRVDGGDVIYAENYKPGKAHDFLGEEETEHSNPSGDLLAGRADEPFNLFSESNKERQQREARELADQNEAKAKQAAINKAESDKLQGNLFGEPPVSKGVLSALEQAAKNAHREAFQENVKEAEAEAALQSKATEAQRIKVGGLSARLPVARKPLPEIPNALKPQSGDFAVDSKMPADIASHALHGIALLEKAWGIVLPKAKLAIKKMAGKDYGKYDPSTNSVHIGERNTIHTAIHEVAHWLDHVLGGRDYASRQASGPARGLADQMIQTSGMKAARLMVLNGKTSPFMREILMYLLQPHEMFARALEHATAKEAGLPLPKYDPILRAYAELTPSEVDAIVPHVKAALGQFEQRAAEGHFSEGPTTHSDRATDEILARNASAYEQGRLGDGLGREEVATEAKSADPTKDENGKVSSAYIKELYKKYIRENLGKPQLTERQALEKVHADVSKIDPSMTPGQVRDKYVNYGPKKKATKTELQAEQARITRLSQIAAQLERIRKGEAPAKFNNQGPKVPDVRQAEQEMRDEMRKMGIKTTREDQLTDARKAVETRLKNQWRDLVDALHGKVQPRKDGKPIEYTPEMKEMKRQIQELHEYLADLTGPNAERTWQKVQQQSAETSRKYWEMKAKTKDFGRAKTTFDADQVTKAAREQAAIAKHEFQRLRESSGIPAKEANERQIAQLTNRQAELKRQLADGEQQGPNKPKRPMSAEAKLIKAENDRISELLNYLRPKDPKTRDPLTPEQRAANAEKMAERTLANLEKEIAGEARVRPDKIIPNAKLRALRAEAESLRGIRDAMREAKVPRRTPEQIANEQMRKRLAKSTYNIEQKLRTGDFSKKTKEDLALEDATKKAQYEHQIAKHKLAREQKKIEMANRSDAQKVADAFVGWRRINLLSGYHVIGKLFAAAMARHILRPMDELAGSALKRLPLISEVAARAPRHGGGLNLSLEVKSISEGFDIMMRNAGKILKTGQTPADAHSGKFDFHNLEHFAGKPVADFLGGLHTWLKSSAKESEWRYSFETRLAHADASGEDIKNPFVQQRIAMEAYHDANAAIFQQKNVATDGWKAAVRTWENSKSPIARGLAVVAKAALPITTVPSNFIGEAINRTPVGIIRGAIELRGAIKRGLNDLSPAEHDAIMRHLKQGTVGTGLLLLGYLAPQIAGGYYQAGEKRKHDDLGPGDIGAKHTHFLLHNPAAEMITAGATVRKVADHMLKGHPEGFIRGAAQGFLGIAGQTPFLRSPADLSKIASGNRGEQTRALGNLVQGIAVPRGLIEVAQDTDSVERRKAKELPDYLKAGIPGLRQTLPVGKVR